MISSPRTLSIFTTIKVFIHYHILLPFSPSSHARARERRGRRNTHGGMRNAHIQEDRSARARGGNRWERRGRI